MSAQPWGTNNTILAWALCRALPASHLGTGNFYTSAILDAIPKKKPTDPAWTCQAAREAGIPGQVIYYFEWSKQVSDICDAFDRMKLAVKDEKPVELSDGVTVLDVAMIASDAAKNYRDFLQLWRKGTSWFKQGDEEVMNNVAESHEGKPIRGTITLPAFRMVNIDASDATKRKAGF